MDVSIVIINWNGLNVLRNCLDSLFASPQGIDFEVIVVDNASHDESVAMMQRDFPQVIVMRNTQNLGFAAANNQAFKIARGRHVLLLNNDTLVLEGALRESVRYLDAHPRVGALGCRVEFPDRSFQTSCYRFNEPFELFMTRLLPLGSIRQERLNIGRYCARQFREPTPVDCVAGCYMLVRAEVIATVGGFDEDFFMYGEDEEWCSRIHRGGWSIIYFPGATIIHLHRFSSRRARRALRIIESMSPVLVLHKRNGFFSAWRGNVVLLGAMLVRLPGWLVLDAIHVARKTAEPGIFGGRFKVLAAHLRGLFSPVWLPAPRATPASGGAATQLPSS